MSEVLARMGLSAVLEGCYPGMAPLLAAEGPEAVWQALLRADTALGAKARVVDLDAMQRQAEMSASRFVTPLDAEWTSQLGALEHVTIAGQGGAPVGLWLRGPQTLTAFSDAIAVVGSRASSNYGETAAGDLAAGLARRGIPVLSGGAYGIDAAAHRGALAVSGVTAAVLACGVDVTYPQGNANLLTALAREQLVISELPPGTHPTKSRFLARNRLIAALSAATVLVEAAARSGAKNTVNWAQRCNRLVFAVPGPISSQLSATPHRLIRDQEAVLVSSAEEIIAITKPIGATQLIDAQGECRRFDELSPAQQAVLELVPGKGTAAPADIAIQAGLSYPDCLMIIRDLSESGYICHRDTGEIELGQRRADVVRQRRSPIQLAGG
ncbi:MAG: DNA-processing protein DprA [Propionibacteriaceae bacterium]